MASTDMIRNRICSRVHMQVIRIITISLSLFLGLSVVGEGQTISRTVSTLVDQIAQSGSLGFDQDAQYQRFLKLNESATDDELILLTDHAVPAVRGYAFWALAKRNYPDLRSIFVAHRDDKASVFQKNGCMVGNESVISFMKQVVTPYMYDLNCMKLDDETRGLVQ